MNENAMQTTSLLVSLDIGFSPPFASKIFQDQDSQNEIFNNKNKP